MRLAGCIEQADHTSVKVDGPLKDDVQRAGEHSVELTVVSVSVRLPARSCKVNSTFLTFALSSTTSARRTLVTFGVWTQSTGTPASQPYVA